MKVTHILRYIHTQKEKRNSQRIPRTKCEGMTRNEMNTKRITKVIHKLKRHAEAEGEGKGNSL